MENVTKRKKVQKKSATTRAAAEKKRLDKVQKKYGGKKTGGGPEKVADAGVTREDKFLYYIDKDGDVARSEMARGRK